MRYSAAIAAGAFSHIFRYYERPSIIESLDHWIIWVIGSFAIHQAYGASGFRVT
ncbi:MAG TPA: hypothetical protein VKZ53_18790 [Candidatus Angelobacter sp.]|nr:hypothetical protein [Candidatus Angelobacter sp.]